MKEFRINAVFLQTKEKRAKNVRTKEDRKIR